MVWDSWRKGQGANSLHWVLPPCFAFLSAHISEKPLSLFPLFFVTMGNGSPYGLPSFPYPLLFLSHAGLQSKSMVWVCYWVFAASVVLQPDGMTMCKCERLQPLYIPSAVLSAGTPKRSLGRIGHNWRGLKTQFPLSFIGTAPFTTTSGRMPFYAQQNQEKPMKCGWNLSFIAMGNLPSFELDVRN